jgi:hypothetical protein
MLVIPALMLLNGVWDLIPQINIGRETPGRRFSNVATYDLRSTNLRADHGKVPQDMRQCSGYLGNDRLATSTLLHPRNDHENRANVKVRA